jgi:hypothetical protein
MRNNPNSLVRLYPLTPRFAGTFMAVTGTFFVAMSLLGAILYFVMTVISLTQAR